MHWFILALDKYFTIKGRAQRKEYWYFYLFMTIGQISLSLADMALIYFAGVSGFPNFLFFLVTIIPALTVCVRRLHDTGRSGWWMLLFAIPIIGTILWIVFCAKDSQPGSNAYGPNPKGIQV